MDELLSYEMAIMGLKAHIKRLQQESRRLDTEIENLNGEVHKKQVTFDEVKRRRNDQTRFKDAALNKLTEMVLAESSLARLILPVEDAANADAVKNKLQIQLANKIKMNHDKQHSAKRALHQQQEAEKARIEELKLEISQLKQEYKPELVAALTQSISVAAGMIHGGSSRDDNKPIAMTSQNDEIAALTTSSASSYSRASSCSSTATSGKNKLKKKKDSKAN